MIEQIAAVCLSIAIHEGIENKVYEDSLGHKTVGVGHLIIENDPEYLLPVGSWVDNSRVIDLFKADCAQAIRGAKAAVPFIDDLPTEVQNILIEMAFQLGSSGLESFRRMILALEAGDYLWAAEEMRDSRWYDQTRSRVEVLSARMEEYA